MAVPAAGAAPALPALTVLVALIVALGLVMVAKYLTGALFSGVKTVAEITVGWVPWVGKKVTGGVDKLSHRVISFMADAATGVEAEVAAAWHVLAHRIAGVGVELAHVSLAVYHLGQWIHEHVHPHSTNATVANQGARLRTVERKVERVTVTVRDTAKPLAHPETGAIAQGVRAGTRGMAGELDRLDSWTRSHVAALESQVAIAIPGTLEGLRGDVGILERGWEWTRRQVRRHERLLGAGAFTAGLAFALSRLGIGWARCTNVRNVGRSLCGMNPDLLDTFLLDALAIVGTISIVTLAEELLAVEDVLVGGVKAGFSELRGV